MNIEVCTNDKKCTHCGQCYAVCPVRAISMEYDSGNGFFVPRVDERKCIKCSLCVRCCPSLHGTVQNPLKEDAQCIENRFIGSYRGLYLAHSTNEQARRFSTSGGVVNSLVRYLIDSNMVDAVLLTLHDINSPIESSPFFLTKENMGVLLNHPREAASRYVSVPVLKALDQIPDACSRLAVVGTPCQIRALTLMQDYGWKKGLEVFRIGICCGHGTSYKATEAYKKSEGRELSSIYYRGDGWPGKISLFSDAGQTEYDYSQAAYKYYFNSQVFSSGGCSICTDHFAEYADISFCDFWNKEESEKEKRGNSCVILRTGLAGSIYEAMINAGYIETVRELSEQEVVECQSTPLKEKKTNVRDTVMYRMYMKFVTFAFEKRIYKYFHANTYKCLCRMYWKMLGRFGHK